MSAPDTGRGGAPVGLLSALDPVEAGAVRCLRQWFSGAEARRALEADFATALGALRGRQVVGNFEELCALCLRHGRRPLMHHHLACRCLGADEACFANLVAAASEGAREDAMLLATLLVRPDMAPWLVGLAETLGLALRQMALRACPSAPGPNGPHHHNTTLH